MLGGYLNIYKYVEFQDRIKRIRTKNRVDIYFDIYFVVYHFYY